jgi:hypothetical protein
MATSRPQPYAGATTEKKGHKVPSSIAAVVMGEEEKGPPSPGIDVHAVLGLPKPKRPSHRSEEEEEEEEKG